jgi:hypothetical protein
MADLNDLTQNVNIWDDAKSKAVDVITDDDGTERLAVDANITFIDNAVVTMEHWIRKLYDGLVFHACDIVSKDKDAYRYVLIKVPSGYEAFLRWQLSSELGITFRIFENPTTTANGTAESTYNMNRNSSNTNNVDAYYDPTVTDEGTELISQLIAGSNQSASSGTSDVELVLKENEDYLLKIISRGNGNDMNYELNWFEESTT